MEGRDSSDPYSPRTSNIQTGPSPFNACCHRLYNPNPNVNGCSNAMFTPPQGSMHHSSINMATSGNSEMDMGFAARSEPTKRKRGRPRKYGTSISPSYSDKKERGSAKKAQLAALGIAGQGFTPHVITIAAGEDVSKKIMAFVQHGPWAVCVLSANGAISNVALRQPAISGGTVTYEGRFEILSLSGSFLLTDVGGARNRTGGLCVSLAGPDGRVIGGGVAGLLMAASPVQVVVGTFLGDTKKVLGQVGNGEPSSGVLLTFMSKDPPSAVAIQSRREAFGVSTGQGDHGEQNTGLSSYSLHPQDLNAMSMQMVDWAGAHFDRETKSNAGTTMTGGTTRSQVQNNGPQACKRDEEGVHHHDDLFED